jgi:hypothetical protein
VVLTSADDKKSSAGRKPIDVIVMRAGHALHPDRDGRGCSGERARAGKP